MTSEGDLLWEPSAARIDRARLTSFASWLGERGRDVASYDALWEWSVADLDGFWSAAAEWFGVRWQTAPGQALTDASMPGAQSFTRVTTFLAPFLAAHSPITEDDCPSVKLVRTM